MDKPTCSIDRCEKTAEKRGWCGKHYRRYQRHGHPLAGGPARNPLADECKIDGCSSQPLARNLCRPHYHQEMMATSSTYRDDRKESYNGWAARNAEYEAERRRIYREENRAALREYDKQRYADNPGLMQEKSYIRRRNNSGLPVVVVERVHPDVVTKRDGGTCQICKVAVDATVPFPEPLSATIDHIIPVSHPDSEHSYANTQLAHWDCNRRKSTNLDVAMPSTPSATWYNCAMGNDGLGTM